jgi:hypothetical protein
VTLDLYSEPYKAGGSINATGATGAIGRPRLNPWELFIREALQNSWDARLHNDGHIRFSVDAFQLTPEQRVVLKDQIFSRTPEHGLQLRARLNASRPLTLLVVTDQMTRGLCGPTRADRDTMERTDFVDFARNVGRASGRAAGGGTYGFGKGVLFGASTAGTVLAYSRTTHAGIRVSRLMGIGLGKDYAAGGVRHTGRHFWGVQDSETGVDPLEGARADELAESIGLTRLGAGSSTGTALAVVAPFVGEGESTESIVEQIVEGLLWSAWPHIVDRGDGPPVHFDITHAGHPVPVPDPRVHPVLKRFVGCYERAELRAAKLTVEPKWPYEDEEIRSQRPASTLGQLSYRRYVESDPAASQRIGDRAGLRSSVALMRNPRFVVKYLPVNPDATGQATAGVFIADRERDADFAKSEPVAHEDWLPENLQLQRYARNPVKQALDKIQEVFRRPDRAVQTEEGIAGAEGVVRLANMLGDLVDGLDGRDSRMRQQTPARPRGRGSSGAGTRPRATIVATPELRVESDRIVSRFVVAYEVPEQQVAIVRMEPRVRVDGGVPEGRDGPVGAPVPRLAAIEQPPGLLLTDSGDGLHIEGPASGTVWVDVHQPDDTMVTLDVSVGRGAE